MPSFSVSDDTTQGRLGVFSFESNLNPVQTPFMFPVASLITGTTARGGGIWKYILQADPDGNSLMRADFPILSQVLHFLDYRVSADSVAQWRRASIRERYQLDTGVEYSGALFLDSGGFKLMWRDGLNLDKYGIDLSPSQEAISITQLQLDFGATIIASLDYPLPPNLRKSEAKRRMERSRNNALEVGNYLRNTEMPLKPFFYIPVHGLTPKDMKNYVKALFRRLKKQELINEPIGIAIGSLVPLRNSRQNLRLIIEIAGAAKEAVPRRHTHRIPLHVFGITGLLLPFLAYLGIDTFDSSTYVKEAINLGYLHPESRQSFPFLELEELPCNCSICKNIDLKEMQKGLATNTRSKPLPIGFYKSKYYADIALHNLRQDQVITENTQARIKNGDLDEYIIELAHRFPRMQYALEALSDQEPHLRQKATRTLQPVKRPKLSTVEVETVIHQTLTHKPSDFDITANGYKPPQKTGNHVLLLLPCSSEKPYSLSNTHQYVQSHLVERFPQHLPLIHKVSLSGLYGPVPEEYENATEILEYNYRLLPENKEQIQLCVSRLSKYLELYQPNFTHCVAYATSKAYRSVFEQTAKAFPQLEILPQNLKSRRLTEFFRSSNIEQLLKYIESVFVDEV